MRTCGCGERGRHKKDCVNRAIEPQQTKKGLQALYYEGYGKPPKITWYRSKSRQATVERRITSLVRRYKSFYLTIADAGEVWYIDGGNWATQQKPENNKLIGHVKNLLPFLNGKRPVKWGDWNKLEEEIKPKIRRRRR